MQDASDIVDAIDDIFDAAASNPDISDEDYFNAVEQVYVQTRATLEAEWWG